MKKVTTQSVLSDATYAAAEKVEQALEQAIASAQVCDDAKSLLELVQAVNSGTDPLAITHAMKIIIKIAQRQEKAEGPLAEAPFDVALDAVSGLQNAIICQMADIEAIKAKATAKRGSASMH